MTLIVLPERNIPGSGSSADVSSSRLRQGASTNTTSTTAGHDIPVPSVEVTSITEVPGNDSKFQPVGTEASRASGETPMASLTEVGAAIDEVAAGRDTRDSSINLGCTLTPPRSSRRRRSRSRSFEDQQHNVNEEDSPVDAFNESGFQAAFRGTKKTVNELSAVLGTSSFPQGADSKMRELRNQAESLADFQHPATRNVGFVGESGVGKSSLLNSLLDYKDLARASSNGGACTCVVTEYCYENCDKLRVESELASEEELVSQLIEMLQAYRQYNLFYGEMEASEREIMEERAKWAEDTFKALFRGRLESLDFLARESESSILDTFRSWISQLRPTQSDTRASGLTPQECAEMLKMLSSESPDLNVPVVWPYLRKIRVFLNAHILKKGLILTDLPGLRDINTARKRITETYLWKCDEIFIVCQIGRATTDEGVNAVFKLAETAKVQVGIICTMSENIDANEAKNDWPNEISQRIKAFQHTIETEEREYKKLEQEIRCIEDLGRLDELEEEDRDDWNECIREQSEIQKRLDKHKLQQTEYLMGLRNAVVAERLRSVYLTRATQQDLPVYCISNRLYWERRYEPNEICLPYLKLSGILELRKHCIAIVSAAQYKGAVHYMTNEIPELLGKITLWVQSGAGTLTCERKALVRSTCDEVEKRLTRSLQGRSATTANVSRSMKQLFKSEIYDSQDLRRWNAAATMAADDWACWAHGSYSAFCRNYGHHATATVRLRNWNMEAIQCMVDDFSGPWGEIYLSLDHCMASAIAYVENLNENTAAYLESKPVYVVDQIRSLEDILYRQNLSLSSQMEAIFRNFEIELRTLRLDSLTGNRTSFIGKSMEDTYNLVRRESGPGSHARRKTIINGRVTQPELFRDIMSRSKAGFDERADSFQYELNALIGSFLERLRDTLDIIRNDNVAEESERDPAFRSRVDIALTTTREKMHGFQAAGLS